MNHVRPHAPATADLREHAALACGAVENAAFDDLAHTADVRRVTPAGTRQPARSAQRDERRHLLVAGDADAADPGPDDRRRRRAAVPLRPAGGRHPALRACRAPRSRSPTSPSRSTCRWRSGVRWAADHAADYYGSGRSLLLELQAGGAAPEAIAMRTSPSAISTTFPAGAGLWAHPPVPGRVAIDPVRGRVRLGTPLAAGQRVLATCHQGHALPIGATGIGAGPVGRAPAQLVEPVLRVSAGANLQTAPQRTHGRRHSGRRGLRGATSSR